MTRTNPLFSKFDFLEPEIPWVKLIKRPTGVEELRRIGLRWGRCNLFIKREDQTDTVYGGNKVRNLEFVLGQALATECKAVVTLVPYGSNFTAALSAQAQKHGLTVFLSQFTVFRNEQIDATARFSAGCGARISTFEGKGGALPASVNAAYRLLAGSVNGQRVQWITPGASNYVGAFGHANALMEMAEQVREGQIPEPDYIIVGAGTCGTIAGILAGIKVLGLKTKVIGVRCADSLVCNQQRVLRIANTTLTKFRSTDRIRPEDVRLERSPENIGYAIPIQQAADVMVEFNELEGIPLDTTYTSKVGLWMKQNLWRDEFAGRNVLYWHTFSPAALGQTARATRKSSTISIHGTAAQEAS